ncbi:AMP-binding protein [Mycolicibacterium boenickei]
MPTAGRFAVERSVPDTTAAWLRRGVEYSPHETSIVCGDVSLTYAGLDTRCKRLAATLRAQLRPGDRVAVLAANCHKYLELYLAVTAAGLVFVPLDPTRSRNELRTILNDAGASLLFADRHVESLGVKQMFSLADDFDDLIAAGTDIIEDQIEITSDMLAALFYTGGTTGSPKGVMLSHGNLAANAHNIAEALDMGSDTRWLVAAPMFHISGTIGTLATIGCGGRHVVARSQTPDAILDVAAQQSVTTTLVLPPMLAALTAAQGRQPRCLDSLQMITHGGAPITESELINARGAFPDTELVHLYGATELSPIATILREEQVHIGRPTGRSCGLPVGDITIEVRTAQGDVAAVGEAGEICIRGSTVMAGYWLLPDKSASALVDGWYRTGDIGWLDDSGFLYVADRAGDVIVSNDCLIFSTSVERALHTIDGVLETAAMAAADGGIDAFVVSRAAHVPDACRAVLARFGVPFHLTVRAAELPRSGAGKILKRELAQQKPP